jgi:hypothetical protein
VRLTPRHYAYLKISEGCNNACSFCIIPALRGRLQSRPLGDVMREAERLVTAGVQELLVISQDTSAYGLDIGLCNELLARRGARNAFPEPRGSARLARRLGASPLRLSLSACRSRAAADGRWPRAELSRHPFPACEPLGAEGDAAAGASGEDPATHRALAPDLPGPCHSLDLHGRAFPGRPRRTSSSFSIGLKRRSSRAWAASNMKMSAAPPRTRCPVTSRKRSSKSVTTA